jgi:hypothetical protein
MSADLLIVLVLAGLERVSLRIVVSLLLVLMGMALILLLGEENQIKRMALSEHRLLRCHAHDFSNFGVVQPNQEKIGSPSLDSLHFCSRSGSNRHSTISPIGISSLGDWPLGAW